MRQGRPPKYPWRKMKVGDKFIFDKPSLRGARVAAYQMNVELGKYFQVRKTLKGIECVRIR